MECKYQQICGGCPLRGLSEKEYQNHKIKKFEQVTAKLCQTNTKQNPPVFIPDGCRRRAEMAFKYHKGNIILGFNVAQSHQISDVEYCLALTEEINRFLPNLRCFLQNFCSIKQNKKIKNKLQVLSVTSGDVRITQADNGLDILLLIDVSPCLEHRMEISDFVSNSENIARFSVSVNHAQPETIAEKIKPFIKICGQEVLIPSGTFLQPSVAGQQALIDTVMHHIGNASGNIADLFCGVGTFSYPLAQNIKNKITAADSSEELLNGFQQTVNKLMIPNIKIICRNLFKYPLDKDELKSFDIVVFDPPRAGAKAQVQQIATMSMADKPQKIVAISCNPYTFINDAEMLICGGYRLSEITMIDQFVYTEHFELVALFEKN